MGPRHWAYVAMLAFCLFGTLPLQAAFGLRVLQQVRRLCLAILPVAAVFVLWDLAAAHAGQWRFDPAQTLPPRLAGLPLEEVGFFLVIPLAGILCYEAVKVVRGHVDPERLDPERLDPEQGR
jgi:lycopene cyclase domain-containing protein